MRISVPVGSLVVIDSVLNNAVTMPFVFRVIKEGVATVSITRLDATGEVLNPGKSKDIRKSSIVAILDSFDDFQKINQMNNELSTAYPMERKTSWFSTRI